MVVTRVAIPSAKGMANQIPVNPHILENRIRPGIRNINCLEIFMNMAFGDLLIAWKKLVAMI